jgi:hypothetical protein
MTRPVCPRCGGSNIRRSTAYWQCLSCDRDWQEATPPPECLNGPSDKCRGAVEYRLLPGPADARSFPRCEFHFEQRLTSAERDLELLSPCIPSWFDPMDAGEAWGEDDY